MIKSLTICFHHNHDESQLFVWIVSKFDVIVFVPIYTEIYIFIHRTRNNSSVAIIYRRVPFVQINRAMTKCENVTKQYVNFIPYI